MANRPLVIRPVALRLWLPEDLRARIDLHLWSDVEQRVPKGAYAKFFAELVREFFERKPDVHG